MPLNWISIKPLLQSFPPIFRFHELLHPRPTLLPAFFRRSEFSRLNIDPFSGWVREIGNGEGGETAPHLNGDGGEGDWTMKVGGRKERIVVSQDEIAMRIQRKMEYVGKCKTYSDYSD